MPVVFLKSSEMRKILQFLQRINSSHFEKYFTASRREILRNATVFVYNLKTYQFISLTVLVTVFFSLHIAKTWSSALM